MSASESLERLSKYAGERPDFVQAGGGNTSVKTTTGTMLIKASGCYLADVTAADNYVILDLEPLVQHVYAFSGPINPADKYLRETNASQCLKLALHQLEKRPSIETFVHAVLDTYTLHTHPVVVNSLTNLPDWNQRLAKLFPDAVYVPYYTPGIDLALGIHHAMRNVPDRGVQVIFLQNHGLVVTGSTEEVVYSEHDNVVRAIEGALNLDHSHLHNITHISAALTRWTGQRQVVHCCQSRIVEEIFRRDRSLFHHRPFCADTYVYCGVGPVQLDSLDNSSNVLSYYRTWKEWPKVLLYQDHVYCIGHTLKKAREVEDVLSFHLQCLDASPDVHQILPLDDTEIRYLAGWDAEIYRKSLG